ncbi:DUF2390 domain-containing protein [Alteromonas oceanisediminis]|uniref:DUF2390 domain-containing protein n=1 Tax=Alteromonas oceanisediminis TaxID=2836180 RepID=UPI001BD9D4BB|nr:DUF2390 domain-containing protein [Alteromonas oceanisediminis]MBT0587871.1 DUF2390 domain-containing protein [Alteromonas oceanisediminis]
MSASVHVEGGAAWQHALQQYDKGTVAKRLIALQDCYGININLCLLFDYLDTQGFVFNDQCFSHLAEAINASEQQLARHRAARRTAKETQPTRYQALLSEELELEKQQHGIIIDYLNQTTNAVKYRVCEANVKPPHALTDYLTWKSVPDEQITALRAQIESIQQQ